MEPGTFVLQLIQPSIEPSAGLNKRRKTSPDKYLHAELPGATGNEVVGYPQLAGGQLPPTGPQALTVEAATPAAEDVPLVLAVKPQAPAWVQPTVHFLQTGELPEELEEAEKVARRSNMY